MTGETSAKPEKVSPKPIPLSFMAARCEGWYSYSEDCYSHLCAESQIATSGKGGTAPAADHVLLLETPAGIPQGVSLVLSLQQEFISYTISSPKLGLFHGWEKKSAIFRDCFFYKIKNASVNRNLPRYVRADGFSLWSQLSLLQKATD